MRAGASVLVSAEARIVSRVIQLIPRRSCLLYELEGRDPIQTAQTNAGTSGKLPDEELHFEEQIEVELER